MTTRQALNLVPTLNVSEAEARSLFVQAMNSSGREFVDQAQFLKVGQPDLSIVACCTLT